MDAKDGQPADYFQSISNFDGMEISMDAVLSVVPPTVGIKPPEAVDQTCLVIFFSDGNREKRAKSFIKEMEHQPVIIFRLPLLLLFFFLLWLQLKSANQMQVLLLGPTSFLLLFILLVLFMLQSQSSSSHIQPFAGHFNCLSVTRMACVLLNELLHFAPLFSSR